MSNFKPTHKIIVTPHAGAPKEYLVMLCADDVEDLSAGNGIAYTEKEWEEAEKADWELVDGEWLHMGNPIPSNIRGTVEVEEI